MDNKRIEELLQNIEDNTCLLMFSELDNLRKEELSPTMIMSMMFKNELIMNIDKAIEEIRKELEVAE